MAGEMKAIEIAPELAAALVAAQKAARAVIKSGFNAQLKKSYATADDIAAAAKQALNEHGAAFARVGVSLEPPALASANIGNQSYVGDAVDHWILVHESGKGIEGSQRMPVIANASRPHEKAVSATLTYGTGVGLRGLLCLEREEKGNNVDGRDDFDDGSPAQYCSKAEAEECTKLCYALAATRSTDDKTVHRHDVFVAAWKAVALADDSEANPNNMTPGEAKLMLAWLRETSRKLEALKAKAAASSDPTAEDAP